jgi:hypothetical protein
MAKEPKPCGYQIHKVCIGIKGHSDDHKLIDIDKGVQKIIDKIESEKKHR